jgi:hypothetical protein
MCLTQLESLQADFAITSGTFCLLPLAVLNALFYREGHFSKG